MIPNILFRTNGIMKLIFAEMEKNVCSGNGKDFIIARD